MRGSSFMKLGLVSVAWLTTGKCYAAWQTAIARPWFGVGLLGSWHRLYRVLLCRKLRTGTQSGDERLPITQVNSCCLLSAAEERCETLAALVEDAR